MEPQAIGFTHFLAQTDPVAKLLLGVLVAMSVLSWYLIAFKALSGWLERRRSKGFLQLFWSSPSAAMVQRHLQQHSAEDSFSRLASHAVSARRKGDGESLMRAMRRVMDEETVRHE